MLFIYYFFSLISQKYPASAWCKDKLEDLLKSNRTCSKVKIFYTLDVTYLPNRRCTYRRVLSTTSSSSFRRAYYSCLWLLCSLNYTAVAGYGAVKPATSSVRSRSSGFSPLYQDDRETRSKYHEFSTLEPTSLAAQTLRRPRGLRQPAVVCRIAFMVLIMQTILDIPLNIDVIKVRDARAKKSRSLIQHI